MALDVQLLSWDTRFFGYAIGRIDLHFCNETALETVLKKARRQGFRLLYVFTASHTVLSQALLHRYTGSLVDTKVTYSYALEPSEVAVTTAPISEFSTDQDVSPLYELAYQSGEYSRFNIDPAFGAENFKRLYRQWIDNSLSGQAANATFVYVMNTAIYGFITVQKTQPVATIGLMATDRSARGRGIGSALLDYVKHDLRSSSAARLDVATQKRNTTACRFYERNGFAVQSEVNVYHIWL